METAHAKSQMGAGEMTPPLPVGPPRTPFVTQFGLPEGPRGSPEVGLGLWDSIPLGPVDFRWEGAEL